MKVGRKEKGERSGGEEVRNGLIRRGEEGEEWNGEGQSATEGGGKERGREHKHQMGNGGMGRVRKKGMGRGVGEG